MKLKCWPLLVLSAVLVAGAGCSGVPVTSIDGADMMIQQVVRSEVDLNGDNIQMTFLRGSYVPRLAIDGTCNTIILEDGAAVAWIDVDGQDNEVRTPQGAPIIIKGKGSRNDVISH